MSNALMPRLLINVLKDFNVDPEWKIITDGAFNTHVDSNLDNLGGRIESKSSVKRIEGAMIANELINMWRICKTDKKQVFWS